MNTALSAIGIAKQSGKGSAASEPAFWQGVTGGKMVDISPDQKPLEETSGLGAGTGEYREAVSVGADYGLLMKPKGIGALLLAILGSVTTTGASAPYSHAFVLGSSVSYFTLFGQLDSEFRTAADCKLDELSIAWDGNKPVEVNATWLGCTPGWDTAFTPTNDERTAAPVLAGASGSWFKYDIDGTTPAAAKILGGKITLKRGVGPDIISGSVTPDDVNEGSLEGDIELRVRAASLADLRTILTGTSNGTTIAGEPVYGSADIKFVQSATSLNLVANKIPFTCDTPEADPKGGPVELTLKGGIYVPSGGTTPITATLVNAIASY